MIFSDLEKELQENIVNLLNNHIANSANILKKDRCLIPMLMIPDTRQLISLQSKDGSVDVDKAYSVVVEKLKNVSFELALFSYSTRIGFGSGNETDALKTYIFTSTGIEVSFYTPYEIKGLFKKAINIEKTIFGEIKEKIFN